MQDRLKIFIKENRQIIKHFEKREKPLKVLEKSKSFVGKRLKKIQELKKFYYCWKVKQLQELIDDCNLDLSAINYLIREYNKK